MRREILGVVLIFVLLFAGISLISYHPSDFSADGVRVSEQVQNLFGPAGAHVSGFLIELFGLGAFWIPIVLLLITLHVFRKSSKGNMLLVLGGGLLLAVTTGGMLSFFQKDYLVLGREFSSGGYAGIPLARALAKYINTIGGLVLLLTLWTIGFIMMTRLSLAAFIRRVTMVCQGTCDRAKSVWVITRERRRKAKSRAKNDRKRLRKTDVPVRIVEPVRNQRRVTPPVSQEVFEFMSSEQGFTLPPLNLLEDPGPDTKIADREALHMQSRLLEKKLSDFDVSGRVTAVSPGPVVTMYEYEPAPGVKINKIVNLADDLSLALRAETIRIVAPIPGKAVIGIEVPNAQRENVRIKDIIASEAFEKSKSKLTLALGKDIMGNPVVTDLSRMPHLLIAGATGSGKSVALNAMICSILYKATPDEVKLLLIDPKRIELSAYEGIPHLIVPVVIDAKKATRGLHWAVHEMERRYTLMAEKGVRNIYQYNRKLIKEEESVEDRGKSGEPKALDEKMAHEKLPLILILIDELADLMLVASRDVELALTRLAQMARAAGIHLLIATQRPSVDVLTGIIKANFPTRISFQVSSRTDSRTVLDANGAENLLGNGDMLLLPPGTAKLQRIHGAYVSEIEIRRIIEFLKRQQKPLYREEILQVSLKEEENSGEGDYDEKYDEALALVTSTGQASISMIQRRLRVGYNRAARMIEMMERDGVVSQGEGSKPRDVLVKDFHR